MKNLRIPSAYTSPRLALQAFRWWLIWRMIGSDGVVANVAVDTAEGITTRARRLEVRNVKMFGFGAGALTLKS